MPIFIEKKGISHFKFNSNDEQIIGKGPTMKNAEFL